ncbi:MAG TPA: IclR family transcriptional regulator [Ramlibacter sp.]|nr:IclR family transcriptional regulator [Ramlibacter sp.]
MDDEEKGQHGVQALETGLGVLEALINSSRSLMLKEVAERAAVHPAKAHRYLVSFVRMGYVVQEDNGLYRLGPTALRAGMACIDQTDALRLARRVLDELSLELDESFSAAVWGNHGPTIVLWRDSTRALSVNIRPGSVLPVLSSAAGRVFLSYLDVRISAPFVEQEMRERKAVRGNRTPTPTLDVEAIKAEVRRTGAAIVSGEVREGISAVAVPVLNHEGRIVLVLASFGSERSFDIAPDGAPIRALKRAAASLSLQLGFNQDARQAL